jgi:hypothetical protein
MRHRWSAIILQWAEPRVGVANVAWPVQKATGTGRAVSTCSVVTEVLTEGRDRTV